MTFKDTAQHPQVQRRTLHAGERHPPHQSLHGDHPGGHLGKDETAVCNLGSLNLEKHFVTDDRTFDYDLPAPTP